MDFKKKQNKPSPKNEDAKEKDMKKGSSKTEEESQVHAAPKAEETKPEENIKSEKSSEAEHVKEEKPTLTKEQELEQKLDEAQKEINDYKDKYLRLAAEFDNFRRRTNKEKAELILNGSEKCINSILPVLDDLERALVNMEKTEDVKAVMEGISLIHNKFVQILSQNGVKEIETENKELDTDFHEAIAIVPVEDEKQKGKIIDCTQKGYMLNEKVIRHAKVVIGK
jgi:molecular chaperone GrpE